MYAYPNACHCCSVISIIPGSFHAAIQSIHNAIVAEFSDLIPMRDQSRSKSLDYNDMIPDITEATSDEEI